MWSNSRNPLNGDKNNKITVNFYGTEISNLNDAYNLFRETEKENSSNIEAARDIIRLFLSIKQ